MNENDKLVTGLGDGDMQLVGDFRLLDSDGTELFKVDATTGDVTASGTIGGGGSTPGGLSGAVQFNDAGSFGGEAPNLFYDKLNNRLGIGTNTPNSPLHVAGLASMDSAGITALTATDATFSSSITYTDGNEAAGKVLTSDVNGLASWQAASGTPGGASGNVQFNDAGALNGVANLNWDNGTSTLQPYNLTATATIRGADLLMASSAEAPIINATTAFQASGVSGASAGPFTTITSITVSKGIVTAIAGS